MTIVTDPTRGQVASFDVNDYVDCGNDASLSEPNITGKITLAAWVKTNDCGNGQFNPYIAKGDHAYTLQHRAPPGTGINELEIAIYDGTAWDFASTPVDISFNGVWHHLAGTYNGSQIKLYVDGELKDTNDYVGSIPSETNNVNLGTSSDFTDRWYEGLLDDVRIYSRALSQEEVASLAERSTFTQPLEPLLTPQNPGVDLYGDGVIDFRDFAVLAEMWLEEQLWP
jgi:beta-galactosidase